METITIRGAIAADAPAICDVYNQGIEDRDATLETRLRTCLLYTSDAADE